MRSPAHALLRPRRALAIGFLTLLLWLAAIFLWSAQDLLSGEPFPLPYRWLLFETFAIGTSFSAILAASIATSQSLRRRDRLALIGVTALALALLHGWIDALQMREMRIALALPPRDIMQLFVTGLMPFLLIYSFYAVALGLFLSSMAVRESERRLAEAQMAAQQAQLAALRFQLNPHFLFNTLNAISSLIVTDQNAEAERMMMQLSEFMRATLATDPEVQVTLAEELDLTQSYLDIEAVRFGDRLRVTVDCPSELLDALVPNFLLQPVIENSIKYAVAPSREQVTITVRALADRKLLRLSVTDAGREVMATSPPAGTGLGLETVRKRLAALYDELGMVEARATPHGFHTCLTLPLALASAPAAK